MTRLNQLEETIQILNNIVVNELPGFVVAEQLKQGFEYAKEIEQGIVSDIGLLQNLCNFGLPYRDIETLDNEAIESIYNSFEEMKKLLQERSGK